MLRTIIALPDGTEISSGSGTVNAIQSSTLTECVNSGEDLVIGSACANALEATLITPAGGLSLSAGTEIIAYKDDGTTRTKVGTFILEKPTRPTANTMKITGYDKVSKLDKDLTAWLSGLTGWPYTLTTFAGMVCGACGLTFKESNAPNGDFLVHQFSRSSVTGRQIMQWLGEICCRFCRATSSGEIEFAWYTDSGKTITTGGDLYYFQNGLSYEDYQTAAIDAVQIRLADSENGALWPEAAKDANSYIITGNPILNLRITEEDLKPVLANIKAELAGIRYTPCKVSVPANMDIRAGNTVQITDKNGKTITAYVMTKTQTGQKDTLESTGNRRRDTATAANTKPQSQAAESAAANAFAGMTADQMFNKLTDNGRIKGIFSRDGVWVINADEAVINNLVADMITSGTLKSADGKTAIDLSGGMVKFFNGVRTNGLIVQSEETENVRLFQVYTPTTGEGVPFLSMAVRNAVGNLLMNMQETFNSGAPSGVLLNVQDPTGIFQIMLRANEDEASVSLFKGNRGQGMLSIGEDGKTNVSADKIKGKTARWIYSANLGHYVLVSDDE